MVFGVLANMVVFWFSRQREFRADAGAAFLAGRERMVAALEKLRRTAANPSARPDEQIEELKRVM